MEVDRSAPVCESAEITVSTGPETVWDTLTDLRSWPGWMPGVKQMHVDGPVGAGTAFTWKAGPGSIRSEILVSDRPRSVGWKGQTLGIRALHAWRMEGEGERTRVFTEESWNGLLARLLRPMMSKTVKKALDDGVAALRQEAERRAGGAG